MENNITGIIKQAIKHFDVKVSQSGIDKFFLSHPYYPSMKCISDAFKKWNIEHYPLKLDIDEIKELRTPYIAHMNHYGGQFALVYKTDKGKVIYTIGGRKKDIESFDSFASKLSGAVILMNPDEKSKENGYLKKRQKEILEGLILPLVVVLVVFLLVYNLFFNLGTFNGVLWRKLVVTKLMGSFASLMLVLHEFKVYNSITYKLCHFNSKTDCNAILNSNASKVFGWLNWADVGLVYFIGSLVSLSAIGDSSGLGAISILSIIAITYSFYSIYYQAFKIKKWCLLCLFVQVVIITEFLLVIFNLSSFNLSFVDAVQVVLYFSLTTVLYILIKAYLLKNNDLTTTNRLYQKIKKSLDIFMYLLKKSQYVSIPINENSLIFGNLHAPVTITAFLNFHCSTCSLAFHELIMLLHSSEDVKLIFVFVVTDANPEITKLINLIYYKYRSEGQQSVLAILEKRFSSNPEYKKSLRQLIDERQYENVFQLIAEENNNLTDQCKVFGTPTIFVNGYKLPAQYGSADLEFFIYDISKMEIENKKQEAKV